MLEMNDKQKALFDDLTTLQQEIALNSISGMNDIDSYKNSSGKAENIKSMEASVCQILGNLKVRTFIDSIKAMAVNNAVMSRQEMLEEISIIARTNNNDLIEWGYRPVEVVIEETGETEIMQQSFWTLRAMEDINPDHMKAIEEVSVGKEGLKFKRTSKLSAMKQLAELAGYNSAHKLDLSSTDGTMSPKNFNEFYGDDE